MTGETYFSSSLDMSHATLDTSQSGEHLLTCDRKLFSGLKSSPELGLVGLFESPYLITSLRFLEQTGERRSPLSDASFDYFIRKSVSISVQTAHGQEQSWSRAIEKLHLYIWRDMGGSVTGAGTEHICESHEIMTDGTDANQVDTAREGGLQALHWILDLTQIWKLDLEPNRNIILAFNFTEVKCADDD